MSVKNIEQTNINRYKNKSKRFKAGFADTNRNVFHDMLSNFVEHCYNSIEELGGYEDKLASINYALNN